MNEKSSESSQKSSSHSFKKLLNLNEYFDFKISSKLMSKKASKAQKAFLLKAFSRFSLIN